MSSKLYIGNLDYGVTFDQLKDLFSQAGTVVDASVVVNKFSGKSRGFGFVQMSTDEEAQKAIEMFNGQDFMGRNLVVAVAKPKEESAAPQSETVPQAAEESMPEPKTRTVPAAKVVPQAGEEPEESKN